MPDNLFVADETALMGCLYIPQPHLATRQVMEGYAVWDGLTEVRQVKKLSDLPKNVLFWSNLPVPIAWGMGRLQHLKSDTYPGVSLRQMMLRLCAAEDDINRYLPLALSVFHKVWRVSAVWHNSGRAFAFHDGQLAEQLATLTLTSKSASPAQLVIAQQAERDFIPVMLNPPRGRNKVKVSLYLPPISLGTPLKTPVGPWTVEDVTRISDEALADNNQAFFVEVRSWKWDNPKAAWLWDQTDSTPFAFQTRPRFWLAKPEFMWLLERGRPEVVRWMHTGRWVDSEISPFTGPLLDKSLTAEAYSGLLFQKYATSLRHGATRERLPQEFSVAWWQAVERTFLLPEVWYWNQQGIDISQYGGGELVLWAEPDDVPVIAARAATLGWNLPRAISTPSLRDAWQNVIVQHNLWSEVDNLVVPEIADARAVLQSSAGMLVVTYPEGKKDIVEQSKIAVAYLKNKPFP